MDELFRRRRLPHWDLPGATYFITACLEGSIPAAGLADLARFRANLRRQRRPDGRSDEQWQLDCWKRTFVQTENWLDHQPAARHLDRPELAAEVVSAFHHFAGKRYELWSYVAMPSHFHWVFCPLAAWVENMDGQVENLPHVGQVSNLPENVGQVSNLPGFRSPRERIMHSVKRHSAYRCNLLRNDRGTFWQDESYDHCVRDLDEMQRIIDYIEQNPVKAGLAAAPAAWPFSSAADRIAWGIPPGRPLVRPAESRIVGQVSKRVG